MKKSDILLAFSGFIPLILLLVHDPTLLIYSVFVLIYFLGGIIRQLIGWIPLPYVRFVAFATFFGLLSESLVWWNVMNSGETEGFSPLLFVHLGNFFGFYLSIAVGWLIALHFFRFSLLQVFFTQGIFGVVIEQHGAILMTMMANPLAFFWVIYTLPVYASYVSISHVLNRDGFSASSDHWLKYIVAVVVMVSVMFALTIFDCLIRGA